MDFLHQEFDFGPEDVIEVTLDHPANVQLLDPTNFNHYRNGRPFHYIGGYATTSPFPLRPPHQGHWHLVVDLGGNAETVRASVRVLSEPAGTSA
jgi:Domain of unknown function (DUF1883)